MTRGASIIEGLLQTLTLHSDIGVSPTYVHADYQELVYTISLLHYTLFLSPPADTKPIVNDIETSRSRGVSVNEAHTSTSSPSTDVRGSSIETSTAENEKVDIMSSLAPG